MNIIILEKLLKEVNNMRILHYLLDVSDTYGSYHYLNRKNNHLKKYGVEQYYISHESFDNERIKNEDLYAFDSVCLEDFIKKDIQPDIIHFHDSVYNYTYLKSNKHEKLYDLAKDKITVRTIHDYSSVVCPKYLLSNEKVLCEKPINEECLKKQCIEVEEYEEFKRYLNSLKDYDGIFYFSSNIHKALCELQIDESKLYKLPPLLNTPGEFSNPDSNIILYDSRLILQKGVEYLIRAVARMNISDWKLIIAGSSDKAYFKKMIKLTVALNIFDKVDFVGHKSHEEIYELLQKTKIVAFPSIGHETYGFSGAEAISFGVPVVAFNISGIDEWLKDGITGIKVPLQDIDAYAGAMESLLVDDELYARYMDNCIKWSNQLKLDNQVRSLYEDYQDMINRSKDKLVKGK